MFITAAAAAPSIVRVAPPPAPRAVEPQVEVVTYPSLGAAVQEVLDQHPQVVAFGETHPEPGFTYKSTKAYFAEQVVPLLAKEGIKILIIEQILNDHRIEAELEDFYNNNIPIDEEHTPTLWMNIQYFDRNDLIDMLEQCRKYHIKVLAGGMTIEQADETIKRLEYWTDQGLQGKAALYAGRASRDKALSLLAASKSSRFAMYGGFLHNDRIAPAEDIQSSFNFGVPLTEQLGKKYFEVDIKQKRDNLPWKRKLLGKSIILIS